MATIVYLAEPAIVYTHKVHLINERERERGRELCQLYSYQGN